MKQKMQRKVVVYFTDNMYAKIEDFASNYNMPNSSAIKFLIGKGLEK